MTSVADVSLESDDAPRLPGGATVLWAPGGVVGGSRAVLAAVAMAEQAAESGVRTILITGETGTGKELFARGIHAIAAGAKEPFLTINCAAVPEALLGFELFGYEPGAFPGALERKLGLLELAGHGTLLLDDVCDLPPTLQHELQLALERGVFRRLGGGEDVSLAARVVGATSAAIDDAVEDGLFRADLLGCLSATRIDLPPLRQRGGDVEMLARYFLELTAGARGAAARKLSGEAVNALNEHPWPGNVRELRSVIARAVSVCSGDVVQRRHLLFQRRRVVPGAGELGSIIQIPPDGKSLEDVTRDAIRVTLALTQGNLSATARILGISRPTLARKMREAGLGRYDMTGF